MYFNRKLLCVFAAAGLVAGATAQAAGLPVAAGNAFHISGSTALDNQVKDALLLGGAGVAAAQQTCQAGTISVYTDAPVIIAVPGPPIQYTPNLTKSHQATIVCNLNNAIGGLAAGTVVAFTKESNGGSNEGTFYPAQQATLAFFDATQAPAGCTQVAGAGIIPANVAAAFYWTHQQLITNEFDGCTGPFNQIIPDVGLADEDPALFTLGPQASTPAEIAKLNTTPLFQNQFAIAVSLNLYRALQTQQGLTAGDDTLAQMPTLTKQQVAALFGGATTNWNQITTGGTALTAGTVFTCRRGDNSGTNVSADVYFLRNRCSSASPQMVQATTANNTTACNGLATGQTPENNGCHWQASNVSDVTFAGAAGGDVASCLDAHARNGTFAYGPLGATSKFDDPNGANGAATEPGSNHWRYIAIDGHKPTIVSMANGTYDYAFDNVENLWTGLAGNPLAVGQYLGTLFQNAVALSDIVVAQPNAQNTAHVVDANYVTGGLQDGLVGTPNTAPASLATVEGNPVSAFTLEASGTVNNCQMSLPVATSVSKEVF